MNLMAVMVAAAAAAAAAAVMRCKADTICVRSMGR